jgi:molybdopterin-guanine dinucleotide biosynthesis protein A
MFSLAILAGGKSIRMGWDKALMPFLGRPLILRILERLQSLSDEVFVMANRPKDYAFLGVPVHPDLEPRRGVLGGLYSSLRIATHPFVAIVACDMPFANPSLFEHELDLIISTGADVVIPSTVAGLEPLHAVYRSATCLPVIQAALEAGERKVIGWLPKIKTQILSPGETASYDLHQLVFWNLNTPEEFQQAETQARLEDSR